jgi:hypothetical protein
VFWFICVIVIQPPYTCESFDDKDKFMYGGEPLIFSDVPVPYARINESGKLLVPNSKSAYRHLFDEDIIPCDVNTKIGHGMSDMYLSKQHADSTRMRPSGLTQQRKYQDNDRLNRVPMKSY